MKNLNTIILSCIMGGLTLTACTREDEDVADVLSVHEYPQVIYPDDEGDGEFEDEDKMSLKLTLLDKIDPSGEELGGKIIPLNTDAQVQFSLKNAEGFSNWGDYIVGFEAFYEIDDCTNSTDEDIDLQLSIDMTSGEGSVIFPAGVEEIELELELNPDLFDDGDLNGDDRGFDVELTGVVSSENVKVNQDITFEYDVLDDEAIYGGWELDHTNSDAWNAFIQLFSLVDGEVANLTADAIDKIEFEFKYDALEIKIELVEQELVEECGESEMVNKEIEISMEYDEVITDALSGDASFEDKIEQEDGSEKEFKYEGSFEIISGEIHLTLTGEYDDETTDEHTLPLSK